MERSGFSVLVLHSENDYLYQKKLLSCAFTIDLRDIKEKKLMASPLALKNIEKRLSLPDKCVSFLGKGDYHYLTYLFLKKIKKPFNLIVFDNHIDDRETLDKGFISCGSWLNDAACLPDLKKTIVITSNPGLKRSKNEKIEILEADAGKVLNRLGNLPVYISIDKDVLSKKYINTTWDQGDLAPEDIACILNSLKETREILGADICGEPDEFNFAEHTKSEKLNLEFLRILTESSTEKKKVS